VPKPPLDSAPRELGVRIEHREVVPVRDLFERRFLYRAHDRQVVAGKHAFEALDLRPDARVDLPVFGEVLERFVGLDGRPDGQVEAEPRAVDEMAEHELVLGRPQQQQQRAERKSNRVPAHEIGPGDLADSPVRAKRE